MARRMFVIGMLAPRSGTRSRYPTPDVSAGVEALAYRLG
jgi:hypothetical protein